MVSGLDQIMQGSIRPAMNQSGACKRGSAEVITYTGFRAAILAGLSLTRGYLVSC